MQDTTKKKVTKKKVTKKKVTKKRVAKKKAAKPIPKYHINRQSWDRQAVMDVICHRIATSSDGLATICRENKDLPSVSTVLQWLTDEAMAAGEPVLSDMYARAKESQADFMADEIIYISDFEAGQPVMLPSGDPLLIGGKPVFKVDNASVQHARLRTENRKWVAAKLRPRKYGDALKLTNDPESPFRDLTDDELEQRLAAKLAKLTG